MAWMGRKIERNIIKNKGQEKREKKIKKMKDEKQNGVRLQP
jgi:hypothetical protein